MKYHFTKFLFVVLFLCVFSKNSLAQRTEIGISAGGSMYYGDIINDFILSSTKGSCGGFLRYHVDEDISLKFNFNYCRVGGADSTSSSEWQRRRNLSFWCDIFETSAQLEINFVKDIIRGHRLRNRFIPYATIGLGAFSFWTYSTNPLTGEIMKLHNLETEGIKYSTYAVCLPIGLGFKYKITSNFTFGAEAAVRFTNTSYIDDIGGITSRYPSPSQEPVWNGSYIMYDRSKTPRDPSTGYGWGFPGKQRGKIAINDIYAIFGVSLSYRIEFVKYGVNHGKSILKLRYF